VAGFLEGQIAKAIYAGFKGRLLKGQLRRDAPTSTTGDEFGDRPTAPVVFKCQGFTDGAREIFHDSTLPLGEIAVCILGASLKTTPTANDKVSFRKKGVTTWYQLRAPIEVDPADALWSCGAIRIAEPG